MNFREHNAVAARFSAAARTYEASASIQRHVARRLGGMLSNAGNFERILEIGCGTGLLTELLCRIFPASRIDAIDASCRMTEQCRSRLSGKSGLVCHNQGLETFRAESPYPLVVSSSALHWIDPLSEAMEKLSDMLSSRGRLVFAVMVRGTLAELHAARRRAAPDKTPTHCLPAASDVRAALALSGFRIEAEPEETLRQTCCSAEILLRQLHDQGVTGGAFSRSERPLNRTELRNLALDYETRYRSGDGVYASYQVAYFNACKA